MTDEQNMGSLISSLREQTSLLRKKLGESMRSDSRKSSLPPSGRQTPSDRSDLNYSKVLIENILADNQALQEDLLYYKDVFDEITANYKLLRRQLAFEETKAANTELLEQRLERERQATEELRGQNKELKGKYVKLLEVFRQAAFEMNEQERQDAMLIDHLQLENNHLQDILGLTKLTGANCQAIEDALAHEEAALEVLTEREYKRTLQIYLNKRRAPAAAQQKKYLLAS